MNRVHMKRMTLLRTICLWIAFVMPASAQGGGLFDSLLENTPEPTPLSGAMAVGEDVHNLIVTLTAIWGDGETSMDTEHLVVRFDVSNLSVQQVLENLTAVQQTGFVGMEWDSGILELRYPKQGLASASTVTAVPTEKPGSNGAYAADNICDYCGGSGMCSHCILGQCDHCFGEGEIWCESCFGSGTCQSCYGMGGELRYMVGGDNQWVTCSRCGGGGMCRRCNGMGATTCNYCHGTGSCAYCNGTGDCAYCHGTGTT